MIVYRQLAMIPVEIIYSPERERCIILRRGYETKLFLNLSAAIRYARGMGWLNEDQAHEARETAQKTIFSYDRRQYTFDDKNHLSMNKRRVIKSILCMDDPSAGDESFLVNAVNQTAKRFLRENINFEIN